MEKYKPKEGLSLEEQIKENFNFYVNQLPKVKLDNEYLIVYFDQQSGSYSYEIIVSMDLFSLSTQLIDRASCNPCMAIYSIYRLERNTKFEEANTGLSDSLDGLLSFLQRGYLDYPINNKGE